MPFITSDQLVICICLTLSPCEFPWMGGKQSKNDKLFTVDKDKLYSRLCMTLISMVIRKVFFEPQFCYNYLEWCS